MPLNRRKNHLIWIGPLVTFAGGVSYFLVFARYPALRDFPWVNLPLVAIGVGLSGIGLAWAFIRPEIFRGKVSGSIGLALSLGIAALFSVYIFSLSYRMPGPSEVSLSIAAAPDSALPDQRGRPVRLGDFRGRKVVLTFYRGHW